MSLDWNVGDIQNQKELCWVPTGRTKKDEKTGEEKEIVCLSWQTDSLIWASMSIGMGSITRTNWREFYLRMLLDPYSKVNVYKDTGKTAVPEWHRIKIEDVFNHIGLHTNASSKTRAQYLKQLYEREEDGHRSTFRRIEEAEAGEKDVDDRGTKIMDGLYIKNV